jgi:hypothetical protein
LKEWQLKWLLDNKLVYELENIHYKSDELQIETWYQILANAPNSHHIEFLSTHLGRIGRYVGKQVHDLYTFYDCYYIDRTYGKAVYTEWDAFGDSFLYSKIYVPELPEEDIKRITLVPTRFASDLHE